jgi:hypothetical protein
MSEVNNAPGIVPASLPEQSPVIVDDGSAEPDWDPARYIPFAKPGHRAPHARTADGNSLYDSFGLGYTLLAFDRAKPRDVEAIEVAAEARQMPLHVLHLNDRGIAELYDEPLVLIRPNQQLLGGARRLPTIHPRWTTSSAERVMQHRKSPVR